jgi:hypothetical protein
MTEEKAVIESVCKENAKLYKALSKAQGEIENAKFNKTNPHFKSKYTDLGGLRDAYQKCLSKNGLCLTQFFEDRQNGMNLVTRLAHESGEYIDSRFAIIVGTNETMQQIGSKITYARRFSIGSITGIGTEEDDDANLASSSKAKEMAKLTAEQERQLTELYNDIGVEQAKFLNWAQAPSIGEIAADKYDAAYKVLTSLKNGAKNGSRPAVARMA